MKAYWQHLKDLLGRELTLWIGRVLPYIMRRSLRRGLSQVWLKADWQQLPAGAVILAANHHSWWDVYLMWLLKEKLGRPMLGFMREDTLERFPFFRSIGVISRREVRTALRWLGQGHAMQIFPEGEMHYGGYVSQIQPGLEFLVAKTQAPVQPLLLRVVVRGSERPEAFIVLGEAIHHEPGEVATGFTAVINQLHDELESFLSDLHPEATPPGFEPQLPPRQRFDERLHWLGKLWRR